LRTNLFCLLEIRSPMKKKILVIALAISIVVLTGALMLPIEGAPAAAAAPAESSAEFNAYWYSGKAEVSSYTVEMARYGNMHPGKSVLIFVTEDFLLDKQVKDEQGSGAPSTSVLKLNKIDRFTTGIYDYSIMLSAFMPVDQVTYPFCLKTSFSAQDWCGQSFMQVNRRGDGYQATVRSYFESEGDKNSILEDAVLEDALWSMARLNPKTLPIGRFDVIPSSQHQRLRHALNTLETATGSLTLERNADSSEQYIYTVTFAAGRTLKLKLQTVFPYRLYGWEEKVKSGYGMQAQWLTTIASLDKTIKSPYWGLNSPENSKLRKELGLD
jgi:hypothetical protein